jgi:hypothetical protein
VPSLSSRRLSIWTTPATLRLARVPILVGCAFAVSVAVGCAAGDDSKPAPVTADASSKAAPESTARGSEALAEAPKQHQARRRHARPDSDAATARKASRNSRKDDLAALLSLGGHKTTGPAPDAQDPRALLRALKGNRRSQRSRPGSDSELSSAVERLLGEGRPP